MGKMFGGIGDAKPFKDANYLSEGDYLLRIDMTRMGQNRKKEDLAFMEFTVIHVFDDANGAGHRIGESVTHAVKRSNDYFFPEILKFLSVALEFDVDALTPEEKEEIAEDVFSNNSLEGFVLHTTPRLTENANGNPFTRINHKARVRAEKLADILSEDEINRFYPGDALEQLILVEEEEAKAAA